MRIEFSSRGIYLPEVDFWLDPDAPCHRSWLSHSHRQIAQRQNGLVFATPETLEICGNQWLQDRAPRLEPVRYGQTFELEGISFTPYPAGHIAGAAQLLIEWRGERILYTGDIKLRRPICGRPAEIVFCHRIIIASAFALPIFHFLGHEQARERITGFARSCFEEGAIPMFLAGAAGCGQEVVHALSDAGIPVAAHNSIARLLPFYSNLGCPSQDWVPYEKYADANRAIVGPPDSRGPVKAPKNTRIAYVSGWAGLDNARARVGAEELIPYSDHADFEELLALVERSGAREADVVHGYAEAFANILTQRGYIARAPQETASRPSNEEAEG